MWDIFSTTLRIPSIRPYPPLPFFTNTQGRVVNDCIQVTDPPSENNAGSENKGDSTSAGATEVSRSGAENGDSETDNAEPMSDISDEDQNRA